MRCTISVLHPSESWWRPAATGVRAAIVRCASMSADNAAIPPPRVLDCMELEDRILFSATPMAAVFSPHMVAAASWPVHPFSAQAATVNHHDLSPHVAGHGTLPSQPEDQVVLIDSELTDSSQLIAAVAPNSKVFVYDSKHDTAAEVLQRVVGWAEATGNRIEDLAILSHGVGGAFELGDQWISATSLPQTAAAWQRLSSVLAVGADIELFGCNVAAPGSAGQGLLDSLASITHAAVFASTDTTGADGNWRLGAASAGTNPAALSASSVPLDTTLLANYSGVLSTIAVDTTSSAAPPPGGAASLTWSQTINSGSDRILVVDVTVKSGSATDPVASVTYGGQNLTLLGSAVLPNNESADIWYLLAPSVGTANVVVNLTGSCHFVASSTDYFGVNQTTPFGTLVTATGNSFTPSVTLTSAAGQLVVDSLITQGSALSITPTGPGQTQLWSQTTGTSAGDALGGGSYQNGAASVTMSWTENSAQNWAIAAAPLIPAPVTTLTVTTTSDTVDGDTTSTNALVANPGPDGKISLREAIIAADNTVSATPITIDFDIPGGGTHTINLASALPAISNSLIIDATTQPGYAGTPLIVLDGSSAGANVDGLDITGGGSTIRGLAIDNFSQYGIAISTNGGNTIAGNYMAPTPPAPAPPATAAMVS